MYKIVLLRHGESTWNEQNRFTGWTDVPLTEKGKKEAEDSAKTLLKNGFQFDIAYTSYLKRAINTMEIVLNYMDLHWIKVIKSWKLNERHYGALQGLNKAETAKKHGVEQVQLWRRSFDIKPPSLNENDERIPDKDIRYAKIDKNILPRTESLKETIERVIPYWQNEILPNLKNNKILITAHGNSIRAIVKHLDNISNEKILELNIPTGIPLVYEFDDNLNAVNNYYLGNEKEILEKINSVKNQSQP